jgi:large subunit ribosomal protein L7/L12
MNKLSVIKAVREFTGLGLKEAKEITESAPIVCKRGVARSEAEHIVASLREAGATVELRG